MYKFGFVVPLIFTFGHSYGILMFFLLFSLSQVDIRGQPTVPKAAEMSSPQASTPDLQDGDGYFDLGAADRQIQESSHAAESLEKNAEAGDGYFDLGAADNEIQDESNANESMEPIAGTHHSEDTHDSNHGLRPGSDTMAPSATHGSPSQFQGADLMQSSNGTCRRNEILVVHQCKAPPTCESFSDDKSAFKTLPPPCSLM